jgi:hypothetical protein
MPPEVAFVLAGPDDCSDDVARLSLEDVKPQPRTRPDYIF